MKKHLISLLLLLSLLFSLASCNGDPLPGGLGGALCESKEDHIDADENGLCDRCNTDVTVTLDLYAVNDLHGKFDDSSEQPGVDELTAFLRGAETRDEHAIFLSSGDMWQGSAESNATKGALLTDWMNELGFVSMTLGNHEFDWGEADIEANMAMAEFPFLAINIYDTSTNERVEYCDASVTVACGDLTVGIIGAIGDCYSSISSDKTEDVYFKTGSALTALVKEESERLRAAGADLIVYSLHDGHGRSSSGSLITDQDLSSYYDPALSRDGYIDLVFEGHTHRSYALRDTYGVYHLQGGGDNDGISHVEVEVNYVTDEWEINTASYLAASVYRAETPDPLVDTLLNKYNDLIAPTREVLGISSTYRKSYELCQLTAELYYEFGLKTWGEEYDIVLGGGFFKARDPYDLRGGEVKYSDLQTIFPFDNRLQLCSIKGADLLARFINGNYDNYYTAHGADPLPTVDPDATYYIVVDSYTSQYAPNRLTVVKEYADDFFARDLLADYIRAGGMEE